MSPRFVFGRENVPCVAEVVNRSLKADCTDFTMLLLRSLKDNYKKITLPSIVVLMVYWIRNSAFNQESGVRFPAGVLLHKT